MIRLRRRILFQSFATIAVVVPLASGWFSVGGPSAVAAEPWVDARQVGPFICQATFPLHEYDPLLAKLPDLEREIDRTLGLPPAHEPIYIYLFSDAQSHRQYLHQHFPDVPYRRALFVKEGGLAAVYAYRHDQLDIDLRHECTHALLHANLPTVPLWLDEGLAEYFEMPEDQRATDHPHFGALRWNMRLGMVRSVADLEQRQELVQMGTLDYHYAWAWTHFMLHGPNTAHVVLVDYLADVHRGEPADKFSDRLAKTIPDSTDRMVQHFQRWDQ
ncbi:MAG TPA: hypothetical protein VGM76_19055 [Lacipirellulaceae bacterium]|jgi:hypothetical protein